MTRWSWLRGQMSRASEVFTTIRSRQPIKAVNRPGLKQRVPEVSTARASPSKAFPAPSFFQTSKSDDQAPTSDQPKFPSQTSDAVGFFHQGVIDG